MTADLLIRAEEPTDQPAVYEVNSLAFETTLEAELVETLRSAAIPLISLVAELDGNVVGHILFSPVRVRSESNEHQALALGPMAVRPDLQRRGIGSQLVAAGLEVCAQQQEFVVFVLGHPDFYPRFGFAPAGPKALHFKEKQFDPYFFVAELREGALEGVSGWVEYHPVFDQE